MNKNIDDVLTFYAVTTSPTTGDAADIDSSGVPSYRVYEEETGTPILTGNMALLDDANTTGFYSERITLSAANGFENGKCYAIRIAGTVGGVSGHDLIRFGVGIQQANTTHWGGTPVASANVLIDEAITAAKIASDAITPAKIQDGAFTAAKFADDFLTAAKIAADAGQELAAMVETYIVNEGDATAVLQAVADKIAADWVAGDASPLAIISAFKADATLAAMIARIDEAVSTRLATAGYTAPDNAGIAAIKAKTDNLPAAPAATGDIPSVIAIRQEIDTNSTQLAKLGTPAGASVSADIAAVKTDTGNLVSRITSTLFSGITSLKNWLGAIAGKTADSATRTEINATTAGATYNETTDSQEAIRDRGDAAWITGAGGGGGGDATLEKQNEILAAIQGTEVIQVASPNVLGNLVLTQGDDYDGTANPRASWTVTTDYTDGWAVTFTIRDADDTVVYTTTGEVVSSTVVAVTIAAPTGLTMTGCPGQWQGKFDVELEKDGKKKTIALGVCYINEDQTRD